MPKPKSGKHDVSVVLRDIMGTKPTDDVDGGAIPTQEPDQLAGDALHGLRAEPAGIDRPAPVEFVGDEPQPALKRGPKPKERPFKVVKRAYYLSEEVVEALRLREFLEPKLNRSGHVEKALRAYLSKELEQNDL